jgi:NAD(P)-dependent dehydrogenase (short-subunit alcohol dehydrogenase family)
MRVLLVGSSARGLALARRLVADGHAVRAVTRTENRRAELEAAGCECYIGDPDRIGTLRYGLENVTILVWALGCASGPDPEKIRALHGSRLKMMLEKTTDTTVRGVLYESTGTLPDDILAAGVEEILWANKANEIPYALLEADGADAEAWAEQALVTMATLLQDRPIAGQGAWPNSRPG